MPIDYRCNPDRQSHPGSHVPPPLPNGVRRPATVPPNAPPPYPSYPVHRVEEGNPMAVAGFVLSIVSFVIGWLPFVRVPVWILAVAFSAIGLNKRPRGLAIAGLVIAVGLPALIVIAVLVLLGAAAAFDVLETF